MRSKKEPYNWINPSRPATDEEMDELIASWKNSPSYSLEDAKKRSKELIRKWRKEGR